MDITIQNDYIAAKKIGEQFLQAFFAKGPVNFMDYYGNDSLLTFESEVFVGQANISQKLSSLNLVSNFNNYEVQPSVGGLLLFVSGTCCISGEINTIPFVRIIFLAKTQTSYYIKNDIYKLTFA